MDFLVSTVMQNPGQVTILAIGPLTNIAMAMRMEPKFARQRQAARDHGRRDRLAAGWRRQPHAERRVQLLRGSGGGADRSPVGYADRALAVEHFAQGQIHQGVVRQDRRRRHADHTPGEGTAGPRLPAETRLGSA